MRIPLSRHPSIMPDFSLCAGIVSDSISVARERGIVVSEMPASELRPPARPLWPYVLAALAIPLAAAIAERAMGRLYFSKSGTFQFWVNQTDGPETSQQLL